MTVRAWRMALVMILAHALLWQNGFVSSACAQDDDRGNQDEVLENLPAPRVQVRQKPVPVVNQSLASWTEVTSSGQIGNRVRAHWVMLDDNGGLTGTVAGAIGGDTAGMRVFAIQGGNVISETRADNAGNFRLENVVPGNYALVGYSPWSFFGFGLNAIEYRPGAAQMPRRVVTRAVGSRDNKLQVSNLLQDNSPRVRFPIYGDYSFGEDEVSQAAWFGWEGLNRFDVPSTPATTIQSRTIRLGPGGQLTGRVHQINHRNGRPVPVENTSVVLVAGGRPLAETRCNRKGAFSFAGIQAGLYNLVAVGRDGFAATGVAVSASGGGVTSPGQRGGYRYDYFRDARGVTPADTVSLTLMHGEAVGWANHFMAEQELADARSAPRQHRPRYCHGCQAIIVNVRVGCPNCRR
ncbi:MAG: carboxypeptidase-like regulatory domain-containing protein [Pirellulaceae bacterium]